MNKFVKKVSVLVLAVVMILSFAGCSQFTKAKLDESAILTTVGDVKVTAGMVNFYARYNQSLLEGYYSQSSVELWTQEVERGVTYEDTMKDDILAELQDLYLVQMHAEEYEISVTDDELEAIEKAAKAFEKANKKDTKEKASVKKEYAVEYLKLVTLQEKLYDVLEAKHLKEAGKDSKDADAAKEIAKKNAETEYKELVEKWRKDVKITVNEKVWDQISFHDLQVMPIYDEVTTTEDTKKEESTEKTEDEKESDKEADKKETEEK